MKTIILTLVLYLLFLANLSAQWEILNEGFKGSISTIDFVNDNIGWIAGSNGILIKTTDGGETWKDILINENWHISQIDFLNESIGWAVGYTGTYAFIIKSTNGGFIWSIQKQILDIGLSSIYVIDENSVYSIGGNKIYKTTNGGINWINVSPNRVNRNYNSLWFQNSETGIVIGNHYNDTISRGVILKTNNGGSTWDETIVNEFNNIYDLQFLDNTNGYFRANNDSINFLCKTNDLCSSWQLKTQNPYSIGSYQFVNNNLAYAIMGDSITPNNIMKSSDGGITWQNTQSWTGDYLGLREIFFNSQSTGFVIGNFFSGGMKGWGLSALIKFIDGEHLIIQKFSYPFDYVYFINKDKGFLGGTVYGDHGSVFGRKFSTINGGETWYPGNLEWGPISSIGFLNDYKGFYLSGGYGTDIYESTDSGINWVPVYHNNPDSDGYSLQGYDMCFMNQENGYVVGYYSDSISHGPGILATNNSGLTWELEYKPTDSSYSSLVSIHFSEKTGWAVGGNGLILKYTPQTGWLKQISPTDLPLLKVFSLGDITWIVGGYSNDQNYITIFLKSTNNGQTWTQIPCTPYLIYDLDFIDQNIGFAIGYDSSGAGGILRTTDGGNNWEVNVGNLNTKLNSIFIKDNYAWAVGHNGLILRTTNAGATWVEDENKTLPTEFTLEQNYPNPFNQSTKIKYEIPASLNPSKGGTFVTIKVYDVLGREVATLVNEEKAAGVYEVEFSAKGGSASGGDASHLSSAVYFYQLSATGGAGSFIQTKKW